MAVITRYIISLFKQNAIGHNAISLHKVLTLFWAETDNLGRSCGKFAPGGPIRILCVESVPLSTNRTAADGGTGGMQMGQSGHRLNRIFFLPGSCRRFASAVPFPAPQPPRKIQRCQVKIFISCRSARHSRAGGRWRSGAAGSGFRLQMNGK